MLEDIQDTQDASLVSFLPHGRAFIVNDVERFVKEILPRYYKHGSWLSFTRQLSLYGFRRLSTGSRSSEYGAKQGAYYHELFLRGHKGLCVHMRRVGVPQLQCDRRKLRRKLDKRQQRVDQTPNFYAMGTLPY
jgi:hypothetical protein